MSNVLKLHILHVKKIIIFMGYDIRGHTSDMSDISYH